MAKTNVEVQLVGLDGNAFAIMGRVSAALSREGYADLVEEYQHRGFNAESYDDFLQITMEYVEVS